MSNIVIEKIVLADGSLNSDLVEKAIGAWPDAKIFNESELEWLTESESIEDLIGIGKKTLYLAPNKGKFVRKCPGTMGLVCCNYWVIDLVEGCVIDCSYCILQDYLTDKRIRLATNIDELARQVDFKLSQCNGPARFGTGELSDSLMFEPELGLGSMLIEMFRHKPMASLELKTKTGFIDSILELNPAKNIVLGWSLNTPQVAMTEEMGSASIEQRIKAASEAARAGWKVAFHFDPLVVHDDWENGYKEVVEQLFSNVPREKVAWISLGAFRYQSSLKPIIRSRFSGSKVLNQEFVLCPDNKYRYVKPVRRMLFKAVLEHIRSISPSTPAYLCMEGIEMWRYVLGSSPAGQKMLCEIFS